MKYLRVMIVMLLITMTGLLSACGGTGDTSDIAQSTDAPVELTAEPVEPTTAPEEPTPTPMVESGDNATFRDDFENGLRVDVFQREFDRWTDYMLDEFFIAGWQSEGRVVSPDEAVEIIRNDFYPPDGYLLAFVADVDLSLLLGSNPADFFNGGVSFLYSQGWGADAQGEAILVIDVTDDGVLYWKGILFAPFGFGGGDSPGDNISFREMYENELMAAIIQRDFDRWTDFMLDKFSIMGWKAGARVVAPPEAVEAIRNDFYPPEGNLLVYDPSADVSALLGSNPADFFGSGVSFLYSVGWGADAQGEAIVVIDSTDDGVLYWKGILLALAGF